MYAALKRVNNLKISEVNKGCTSAWRWEWVDISEVQSFE